MSDTMRDDAAGRVGPARPAGRVRRATVHAAFLLAAFLPGLVPMRVSARVRFLLSAG